MCELEKAKETRMKKECSLEKSHLLANICMMFLYHCSRVWNTRENTLEQYQRPIIVPYGVCYRQIASNIANIYSLTGRQGVFRH